jgi:hypothetical protein
MYGDTNYSLEAFNLSTGAQLWSPVTIYVAQAFGMFGTAIQNRPPLFIDHDTLSFVVAGSAEQVTGQTGVSNQPGCVAYVLEWNASTGAFLGAHRTGPLGSCIAFLYATEDAGWITVAWFAEVGSAPTNISVETFPEPNPSPLYAAWTDRVAIGPDNWEGWPIFPLTMGGGKITISEMAGNNTTAVLNGLTGTVLWQNPLTGWVATGDNLDLVNYFNNVALDGGNLAYISESDSIAYLSELNLSTFTSYRLAALPISGYAIDVTELETVGGGELVATDAATHTYFAFSSSGQALWNRTLSITETSGAYGDYVQGALYEPLIMGGNELLGTLFQDEAGGPGVNFTIGYSVPIQVMNGTTGEITWQTSYTSTIDISQPASPPPDGYFPIAGVGDYLVYQHGLSGALSVARLPGIP